MVTKNVGITLDRSAFAIGNSWRVALFFLAVTAIANLANAATLSFNPFRPAVVDPHTVVLYNFDGVVGGGADQAAFLDDAGPDDEDIQANGLNPAADVRGGSFGTSIDTVSGPNATNSSLLNSVAISSYTVGLQVRIDDVSASPSLATLLGIDGLGTLQYQSNLDRFFMRNTASQFVVSQSGLGIGSGDWVHLAFSYNSTTGEGKLWLDDVDVTDVTTAFNFGAGDSATLTGVLRVNGSQAPVIEYGTDELFLSNTVLTPVPEPSIGLLLVSGAVWVGTRRKASRVARRA